MLNIFNFRAYPMETFCSKAFSSQSASVGKAVWRSLHNLGPYLSITMMTPTIKNSVRQAVAGQ